MFSCYLHGWVSHNVMCPICQTSRTLTWSSGGTTPSIETIKDDRIKALEEEVKTLRAVLFDIQSDLSCAENELSAAMQSVCTALERVRNVFKEGSE